MQAVPENAFDLLERKVAQFAPPAAKSVRARVGYALLVLSGALAAVSLITLAAALLAGFVRGIVPYL